MPVRAPPARDQHHTSPSTSHHLRATQNWTHRPAPRHLSTKRTSAPPIYLPASVRHCCCGWCCSRFAVVLHVGSNQVVRSKGREKREFPSKNCGGDDPSQFLRIVSRLSGLPRCAANAHHVQALGLCWQGGAPPHCADLDGWHGDGHMQVSFASLLDEGNARGALHILCWVLASSEEDGGDDVGGMRVEAPDCPRHGAPDEVLAHGDVHHASHRGLEGLFHNSSGNDSFDHDRFPPAFNPVDCCGLFISADIPRKRHQPHLRELLLKHVHHLEASF
mmetsp:Transcript_28557/g.83564  ORF Transcript_28557/g.83564 Transcript_28557/m.83564 type:complete len:276 (+) Transcript_28557:70-897(+)